jgi:hypothetical protein
MNGSPDRHPAGVPTGGQFARQSHAEADIDLFDPVPAAPDAPVVSFDPTNETHIATATMAAHGAWEDKTDPAAAMTAALEAGGVHATPGDLNSSSALRHVLDDSWGPDEPDVVPDDDPFGHPGAPTWQGAGFAPSEAARWSSSGVVDPEVARDLVDTGVDAETARRLWSRSPDGWPMPLGQAVTDGHLTAEEARSEAAIVGPEPTAGF